MSSIYEDDTQADKIALSEQRPLDNSAVLSKNETFLDNEDYFYPEKRNIEDITADFMLSKKKVARAFVEIGKLLVEAKALLAHGEWLQWLDSKAEMSERLAQCYMKVAQEYPNPHPVADLGVSKAYVLLALPPVERDEFMKKTHSIRSRQKKATELSKKEIIDYVREWKSTQKNKPLSRRMSHSENSHSKDEGIRNESNENRIVSTETKNEFHTNFKQIYYYIESMAEYIENQRDDIDTYQDTSLALRNLCEDVLRRLAPLNLDSSQNI